MDPYQEILANNDTSPTDPYRVILERPSAAQDPYQFIVDMPDGTRPDPSFVDHFGRGVQHLQEMFWGAMEVAGEASGFDELRRKGTEGREYHEQVAKTYGPGVSLTQDVFTGKKGLLEWLKANVAENLPQIGATAAGAGVGAGIGAGIGLLSGPAAPVVVPALAKAGALTGGLLTSSLLGIGSVQSSIKEKNPEASAPTTAIIGGTMSGALDMVVPGRLGTMLIRAFGKDVAEEVAERVVKRYVLKEAGKSATLEGLTEAFQEAIEEVAGAYGAGKPINWKSLPSRMLDAAAVGAVLGGGLGAVAAKTTERVSGPLPPTSEDIAQALGNSGVRPPAQVEDLISQAEAPPPETSMEFSSVSKSKGSSAPTPAELSSTLPVSPQEPASNSNNVVAVQPRGVSLPTSPPYSVAGTPIDEAYEIHGGFYNGSKAAVVDRRTREVVAVLPDRATALDVVRKYLTYRDPKIFASYSPEFPFKLPLAPSSPTATPPGGSTSPTVAFGAIPLGENFEIRGGDFDGGNFALVDTSSLEVVAVAQSATLLRELANRYLTTGDPRVFVPYQPKQPLKLPRLQPSEPPPPEPTQPKQKVSTGPRLNPVVVDFLEAAARKGKTIKPRTLEPLPPEDPFSFRNEIDDRSAIEAQTVPSTPGILRALLRQTEYPVEQLPQYIMRDFLQSAFHSVRDVGTPTNPAAVHIFVDSGRIAVVDSGLGMSDRDFLEFFSLDKDKRSASSIPAELGIARLMWLAASRAFIIKSVSNGFLYEMAGTGTQIGDWMLGKGKLPTIVKRQASDNDRHLFPAGHGTLIGVSLPSVYVSSSGASGKIEIPQSWQEYPVLLRSRFNPNTQLFYNDSLLPKFPYEDYEALYTAEDSAWGTATVYKSKNFVSAEDRKLHVLADGVWQFTINSNVGLLVGNISLPWSIVLDIHPRSRPGAGLRPFNATRSQFSEGFEARLIAALEPLIHYGYVIRLAMHTEAYKDTFEIRNGRFVKLHNSLLSMATVEKLLSGSFGKNLKILESDGAIRYDSEFVRTILALENSEMEYFPKPEADTLLYHDNMQLDIPGVGFASATEYLLAKHGTAFVQFVEAISLKLRELKNRVVTVMEAAALRPWRARLKTYKIGAYRDLKKIPVGVSFDPAYRGVFVVKPFTAIMLNLAHPEVRDPYYASSYFYWVLIHEIAHYHARSGPGGHDGKHPAEMQRISAELGRSGFDEIAFQDEILEILNAYKDVYESITDLGVGLFDYGPRVPHVFEYSRTMERGPVSEFLAAHVQSDSARGHYRPEVSSGTTRSTETSAEDATPRDAARAAKVGSNVGPRSEKHEPNARVVEIEPTEVPQQEVEALLTTLAKKVFVTQRSANAGRAALRGTTAQQPPVGGSGGVPPGVMQGISGAGRLSWLYKYFFGLDRLVDRFMWFKPLVRYAEIIREMRLDASRVHDRALRIVKRWRRLGSQRENLAGFIDDIMNMTYRSPVEIAGGVLRHPTQAEFTALVQQHKLSREALQIYAEIRTFFEWFLELTTQNAIETARRTISDPVAQAQKIAAIQRQQAVLLSRPYFPAIRFGSHFVVVKSGNQTIHFETVERRGFVSAEKQQQRLAKELRAKYPGMQVETGVLPDEAAPFLGLPPNLLEYVRQQMQLSPAQSSVLDQLIYDYSPAASFVHHFQRKNYVPGYSSDFIRAFSRYAFHGGRYYTRAKHSWALREQINLARAKPSNLQNAIANYMDDHLRHTVLDTKGDFVIFKGAIFLWVFGYSVAGAAVNLSQIPMVSYPFLAAKYGGMLKGDVLASKELITAMVNWKNFYRRGTYSVFTDFEAKAFAYAIETGRISESMASQLAGFAQGETLLRMSNTKIGRAMETFLERSTLMFELTEQFNRRVTFAATLNLAMKYPNAKGVQEALDKYADEYRLLQGSGFTKAQAQAIVAAIHAVEQTQFVYARENRPRFMRGRLAGTIFVFKTYILNVLQLLGADKKSVLPRYVIMSLGVVGLMGLPGAEDLEGIANTLGKWLFGKDFNIKASIREWILEIGEGKVPPDIVLHGLARRGFGLPALLDLIGEHPGRGFTNVGYRDPSGFGSDLGGFRHSQNVPVPVIDMSRQLSAGRILPFDIEKLSSPESDVERTIAEQSQQAAGAIFGVGFNLYKAIHDSKLSMWDVKRWERTMPRALAGLSRSYRAYGEGRERGRGGVQSAPTIVNFDPRDTEQLAEIIAMGLGFTPTRLSSKWDYLKMKLEVQRRYEVERGILLRNLFEAQFGGNKEELTRAKAAVMDFNKELPEWAAAYVITADTIQRSMTRQLTTKIEREVGMSINPKKRRLDEHFGRLFPETTLDVRRVR